MYVLYFPRLVRYPCSIPHPPVSQTDPARTVQIFIDLIQRHEQAFYSFVHKVHSKGEGLFTDLMRWIELFLTLMREGLGERMSLEFLLPHTGPERENIMREVDEIALYHYKLKVAYEAKLRRRFGRTQGMNDADAEDEAAAQLVNGVVRDLSFGDLVKGDAEDLAAQETDEEDDSSDEEYSSDSGSSSSGSDETDSDESKTASESGGETERDGTPHPADGKRPANPPQLRPQRSQTMHHPAPPLRRQPRSQLTQPERHSADIPREERPPPVPPRERSRSLSSRPLPISSRFKDLPPPPPLPPSFAPGFLARQQGKLADGSQARPVKAIPPQKPKKAPAGPTPPQLEHVPKLLPLFVEMASALPIF